eukprot:2737957-Rhodomonas_salina.1
MTWRGNSAPCARCGRTQTDIDRLSLQVATVRGVTCRSVTHTHAQLATVGGVGAASFQAPAPRAHPRVLR